MCVCSSGFTGATCNTCVNGTYPNCYVAQNCPSGCSGQGTCNHQSGVCSCNSGITGVACDSCVLSTDTYPTCSAVRRLSLLFFPLHHDHIFLWSKKKGVACPLSCSGQGNCNGTNGQCTCATGYSGAGCNSCASLYQGYPQCYLIQSCPSGCSGHGTCNAQTGVCSCTSPFGGADCNSCLPGFSDPSQGCWPEINCTTSCGANGQCNLQSGKCACDSGFTGTSCQTSKNFFFPFSIFSLSCSSNKKLFRPFRIVLR